MMKPSYHLYAGFPILLLSLILMCPLRTETQTQDGVPVSSDMQDVLQEVPFWKGFIDSLWTPFDAKFLGASTVVIADLRDSRLVIVDGLRGEMRAIGRRGDGPGEFQAPIVLGVGTKSFYVWDMTAFRLSSFDFSGVFQNSHRVMIPSRGNLSSICETGWHDVALSPQITTSKDKYFGQILLFSSSLDTLWTVDIPCSKLRGDKDDPTEPAVCNMTVAYGNEETMLVGFHNDYTIRRYSQAGDIIWESGSLDPQFKPSKVETSEGGSSYRTFIPNRLTGIWEIEGYGILVGAKIIEGYEYTGEYLTYVDVITLDRGIIQRIQIPDGLEVRDVWIGDGEVQLLTMLFDNIDPLHFAIYSVPLDSIFR